ncbi:MAG: dephospho-CoA kinase [Campylobacteraceae bacterium]|nr:dephospho-CoA kinase [Campylobacteraceae bacterium]
MSEFKNGVVITGGIGSGKSTVVEMLKNSGFSVIDADLISHEILDSLAGEISKLFGNEFVDGDKVLRKKLGNLVFSDKSKLKELENLLHPKIKDEIFAQALKLEKLNKTYFVDIPLFYESEGRYNKFKKVLVIYAPKELCLERIMKRNKLTKDEALVRINSQTDIETKKSLANFVIENLGDKQELEIKVSEFLESLG